MVEALELAIDTASDSASICLSSEGGLRVELTWRIGREHSRQLLPAIDHLLGRLDLTKDDLTALFVCIGPGTYAGVRAGVSTAKGLAYALEQPIVGVGRLEIAAYAHAGAGAPVVAVHQAGRARRTGAPGRGDFAWAAYAADPDWHETSAPRLSPIEELLDRLPGASIVTGDVDDELAGELTKRGHRCMRGAAGLRRAALLAELGWRRLQAGQTDDPKSLVPLYLREPAIGPQK